MSQTNQPAPQSITREQVLAALDTEINFLQAARSTTGRTGWALTLSLSALVWLGIQIWGSPNVSVRNVALLGIILTLLWNLLRNVAKSIDSSLVPQRPAQGRFFSLAPWLGAMRSTILIQGIELAVILFALFRIGTPEVLILKWYYFFGLVAVVGAFIVSYVSLPQIPATDDRSPGRIFAAIFVICQWLARAAVAGASVLIIFKWAALFSKDDVRLAVILAAGGFLLNSLLAENFSATHVTAFQNTRQNLAFSRISVEEARQLSDLLRFVGNSPTQVVGSTTDSLLGAADEIRAIFAQVEDVILRTKQLDFEIEQARSTNKPIEAKRSEYSQSRKDLFGLYRQGITQYERLLGRLEKFETHVKIAALFSASAAKEVEPLIVKLRAAVRPLADQLARIRRDLGTR